MKPSFHARLVNGPFEDPGLYVRILRERRAFMFDLGFTTNLSPGDILKITDFFISHTHIDHFIGFDSILRTILKKDSPVRFYGPEGFIDCVEGKLRSYTWNLTESYPLVIEVIEVSPAHVRKAIFRAKTAFRREAGCQVTYNGTIMKDSPFHVLAAVLDHQIPCLAFSLQEDYHINIDKSRLDSMGLPVGPWLSDLKRAIRTDKQDCLFIINDRTYSFSDVRGVADITKGQKLSYIADAAGSEENIMNIIELVQGSDVLYIETYFLEEDKDRARSRFHLTAKQAGRIAREAGVSRLETFHFSPRYRNCPGRLARETEEEFRS